jgi:hypothetical protein
MYLGSADVWNNTYSHAANYAACIASEREKKPWPEGCQTNRRCQRQ